MIFYLFILFLSAQHLTQCPPNVRMLTKNFFSVINVSIKSKVVWLNKSIEHTSSEILVGFVSTEPQRELLEEILDECGKLSETKSEDNFKPPKTGVGG